MKNFFVFSVAIVFVTQLAMQYGLQSFSSVKDSNVAFTKNDTLWFQSEEKANSLGFAISEDGYFVSIPKVKPGRNRKPKIDDRDKWSSSIPLPAKPSKVFPVPALIPGDDTQTRINNVLNVALSQVGNVGGDPYWKWYGFSGHVEWCACFVSWVAHQNGLIEKGIMPKFAGVSSGANWFIARKQWKGRSYVPKKGDVIFFDWNDNGSGDHVGFVEKVENGKVYTVEGNSRNTCKRKIYSLTNYTILGYGTPAY